MILALEAVVVVVIACNKHSISKNLGQMQKQFFDVVSIRHVKYDILQKLDNVFF